jgi:hypothetical protein
MKLQLVKVVIQPHYVFINDDEKVVSEHSVQQPITIYHADLSEILSILDGIQHKVATHVLEAKS